MIGHAVPDVVTQSAALYATFGELSGWRAALVLPLIVAGEELVWRGAVQQTLTWRFGAVAGALFAGLAYGLAVLPQGSPLLFVIALTCGLYWSAVRVWGGSLAASLICHLIWDYTVFVLLPLRRVA